MAEGPAVAKPQLPCSKHTDGNQGQNSHIKINGENLAVVECAPWLAEALAGHERREASLASEISAVREASASGAAAFIEMRSAVQAQISGLVKNVDRLEQDLEYTKKELAEVVIDKETSEAALRDQMEERIEQDVERTRSFCNEVVSSVRETLECQISEIRQAMEEQKVAFQALDNKFCQALENRLEASNGERDTLFSKFDKVMMHEIDKLREKEKELSESLRRLDQRQEENSRRRVDDLRREFELENGSSRKFQELHEKLEPRVSMLEEAQRSSKAMSEHMQNQVNKISQMASRYPSPVDHVDDPRSETTGHSEEPNSSVTRKSGTPNTTPVGSLQGMFPTPGSTKAEGSDETWRFSNSDSAARVNVNTTSVAGISSQRREVSEGSSRTRGEYPSRNPAPQQQPGLAPSQSPHHSPPPQPQQPQQAPVRYPMVSPTLGPRTISHPAGMR